MTVSWQKVFSTLASEPLRDAYARAILGEDVSTRSREFSKLVESGLLLSDGSVNDGMFKDVLGSAAGARPRGVDRFFHEGRLDGLPAGQVDRLAVLEHLADRLFPLDQELDEPVVNLLVATVTGDIPTLRRALVDFGFLVRNPDGTRYRRAPAG
ncbi:hypothetical protein ASH00_11235 [Arthrobacter sp. Soil782]|uniref:DUF2087 domain-containing protein n=1 Tax=Arthrobacter sp. Soil782 TaxID=1736410 RepID=UPI0006FE9A64|nr:DUF2087 domain-containing protein [Arthrobacter sp. Soil782]KRF05019.1 hypothetical protein ASH00_11235 [Arthrobacter sp. Soil782]